MPSARRENTRRYRYPAHPEKIIEREGYVAATFYCRSQERRPRRVPPSSVGENSKGGKKGVDAVLRNAEGRRHRRRPMKASEKNLRLFAVLRIGKGKEGASKWSSLTRGGEAVPRLTLRKKTTDICPSGGTRPALCVVGGGKTSERAVLRGGDEREGMPSTAPDVEAEHGGKNLRKGSAAAPRGCAQKNTQTGKEGQKTVIASFFQRAKRGEERERRSCTALSGRIKARLANEGAADHGDVGN